MGPGIVMTCSGPLLWPLPLLLLPLTPETTPTMLPSDPGSSKALQAQQRNQGSPEGWGSLARGPQGSEGWAQVCGKPRVMGKVFGGQDAVTGQWPWQASLLFRSQHFCGAVLIEAQWLVSAAHCFLNKSHTPEDYRVLLGNTQLYQQTQHTQNMSVSRIIIHPEFEKLHPFGNDIAMLQLHQSVKFTSYVVPVCLPPTDLQLPKHMACWITGWGRLSEDMKLLPPFSLQEAKVNLVENKLCNTLYGQVSGNDKSYVHEEMLCAGDFSTGRSICRGDSGGPLVCFHPNIWVLVGLASWGLDCQHPVYPSVFTRVAYFLEWISEVKRQTPLLNPVSTPPHMDFSPSAPMKSAGSAQPYSTLMSAQTWLLLPFLFTVPQQASW
ncbi:putative serine protease 47 isoform X10 [Dipodomys merriami]|uniref:putative serine protease 47 isoform X10 n=1 Tax=Dipodomys merriami TaxID=94247 RepID=UPI0038560062